MRILYVEDNPANLFLIKRVAKMGDHEVVNLIDGEEALRKIDMINPDLILMDIQLAGQLTGLDVVRKLRGTGYTMPIVAVTAYAMVGDRERCLEAGCNEYLSKPLPIGRVVELLQLYQAGVPAESPISDDDSMPISIITEMPSSTSQASQASTPTESAAPAATPPTDVMPPTASTEAAPAATPASDVAPASTEAPAASDLAAKGDVTEATGSSMAEDKLTTPQADSPVIAPETPSAAPETILPDTGTLPDVLSESGAESHPAVESTSQDTSHPQDTVQAQ